MELNFGRRGSSHVCQMQFIISTNSLQIRAFSFSPSLSLYLSIRSIVASVKREVWDVIIIIIILRL